MNCQAKHQRGKRVTLLRHNFLHSFQHLVTTLRVERILEIHCQKDMVRRSVVKEQARGVGCSFCSMWGTVAKLPWCQVSMCGLDDLVANTVCRKMTEGVAY